MILHGRIYHRLGALVPPSNQQPFFLSLYIYDTDYATQSKARATQVLNLNAGFFTQRTSMLHKRSLYVQSLSALRD